MSFAEFFKAKGGSHRWPAGTPGGKGGEFAPKSSGGFGGSFFSAWANALSGKNTTSHIPSKETGSAKPSSPKPAEPKKPWWESAGSLSMGGQKVVGAQYGGTKPSQGSLFGSGGFGGYGGITPAPAKPPKGAKPHPKVDDKGKPVTINYPSKASPKETWKDKNAVASFTPGSETPGQLHGVAMSVWKNPPKTPEEWNKVPGQNPGVDSEHPFDPHPTKHTGAGVLILEKDGRIWLTKPTNEFGNYKHTFPKGTVEDGINLQASAIKEAYEETGLKVKITGILGDFERTTSKARYYIAERVGGSPADMGWESQAIRLAPFKDAAKLLNQHVDKSILDALDGEMNIGKSYELTIRAASLLLRLKEKGL